MQIFYQSEKYVAAMVNPGRERLVVTFDHWQRGRVGMTELNPLGIADECGLSQMLIRVSRNDWFLSDETEALMSAVSNEAARYSDVINYGTSMGGFAALLFSKATGAREIHAVAPQYSIDPEICSFETRWQDEFHTFCRKQMDIAQLGNRSVKGIVTYDPKMELDRLQAERILDTFPNIRGASFFHGGHPPLKPLREAGTVGQMGRDILRSQATPETMRLRFRAARRLSVSYWANLGKACLRRHPDVARYAFTSAIALDDGSDSKQYFKIANSLCILGDYSHLPMMKKIAAKKRKQPIWWKQAIARAERKLAAGAG